MNTLAQRATEPEDSCVVKEDEQIKRELPQMTERSTVLPDGRYLIFYEFDDVEEESPNSLKAAGNTDTPRADV